MGKTKNLGFLLLGFYLVLQGVTFLIGIALPGIILGFMAVASGICILSDK